MVQRFIEKRKVIEAVQNTGCNFEELVLFCPNVHGFVRREIGFAVMVKNEDPVPHTITVEPGEMLVKTEMHGYTNATMDQVLRGHDPVDIPTCGTCGQKKG